MSIDDTQHLYRPARRPRLWVVIAVLLLAGFVGICTYWVVYTQSQIGALQVSTASLAQDSTAYRKALAERGVNPNTIAPPPAARTDGVPLAGATGPAGAPASDAQVRAAVAGYFAAHPVTNGKTPSAVDIAAAVANYLSAHPPAAGPAGQDATPDQVAAAVQSYLSNPQVQDQLRGPKGAAGADATPEQIANSVSLYMQNHPLPTCPDGTTATPVTVVTSDPAGTTRIITCVVDTPSPTPTALLLPFLAVPGRRRLYVARHGVSRPARSL